MKHESESIPFNFGLFLTVMHMTSKDLKYIFLTCPGHNMISMYEKAAWILYKMSPLYFTEDTEQHQGE